MEGTWRQSLPSDLLFSILSFGSKVNASPKTLSGLLPGLPKTFRLPKYSKIDIESSAQMVFNGTLISHVLDSLDFIFPYNPDFLIAATQSLKSMKRANEVYSIIVFYSFLSWVGEFEVSPSKPSFLHIAQCLNVCYGFSHPDIVQKCFKYSIGQFIKNRSFHILHESLEYILKYVKVASDMSLLLPVVQVVYSNLDNVSDATIKGIIKISSEMLTVNLSIPVILILASSARCVPELLGLLRTFGREIIDEIAPHLGSLLIELSKSVNLDSDIDSTVPDDIQSLIEVLTISSEAQLSALRLSAALANSSTDSETTFRTFTLLLYLARAFPELPHVPSIVFSPTAFEEHPSLRDLMAEVSLSDGGVFLASVLSTNKLQPNVLTLYLRSLCLRPAAVSGCLARTRGLVDALASTTAYLRGEPKAAILDLLYVLLNMEQNVNMLFSNIIFCHTFFEHLVDKEYTAFAARSLRLCVSAVGDIAAKCVSTAVGNVVAAAPGNVTCIMEVASALREGLAATPRRASEFTDVCKPLEDAIFYPRDKETSKQIALCLLPLFSLMSPYYSLSDPAVNFLGSACGNPLALTQLLVGDSGGATVQASVKTPEALAVMLRVSMRVGGVSQVLELIVKLCHFSSYNRRVLAETSLPSVLVSTISVGYDPSEPLSLLVSEHPTKRVLFSLAETLADDRTRQCGLKAISSIVRESELSNPPSLLICKPDSISGFLVEVCLRADTDIRDEILLVNCTYVKFVFSVAGGTIVLTLLSDEGEAVARVGDLPDGSWHRLWLEIRPQSNRTVVKSSVDGGEPIDLGFPPITTPAIPTLSITSPAVSWSAIYSLSNSKPICFTKSPSHENSFLSLLTEFYSNTFLLPAIEFGDPEVTVKVIGNILLADQSCQRVFQTGGGLSAMLHLLLKKPSERPLLALLRITTDLLQTLQEQIITSLLSSLDVIASLGDASSTRILKALFSLGMYILTPTLIATSLVHPWGTKSRQLLCRTLRVSILRCPEIPELCTLATGYEDEKTIVDILSALANSIQELTEWKKDWETSIKICVKECLGKTLAVSCSAIALLVSTYKVPYVSQEFKDNTINSLIGNLPQEVFNMDFLVFLIFSSEHDTFLFMLASYIAVCIGEEGIKELTKLLIPIKRITEVPGWNIWLIVAAGTLNDETSRMAAQFLVSCDPSHVSTLISDVDALLRKYPKEWHRSRTEIITCELHVIDQGKLSIPELDVFANVVARGIFYPYKAPLIDRSLPLDPKKFSRHFFRIRKTYGHFSVVLDENGNWKDKFISDWLIRIVSQRLETLGRLLVPLCLFSDRAVKKNLRPVPVIGLSHESIILATAVATFTDKTISHDSTYALLNSHLSYLKEIDTSLTFAEELIEEDYAILSEGRVFYRADFENILSERTSFNSDIKNSNEEAWKIIWQDLSESGAPWNAKVKDRQKVDPTPCSNGLPLRKTYGHSGSWRGVSESINPDLLIPCSIFRLGQEFHCEFELYKDRFKLRENEKEDLIIEFMFIQTLVLPDSSSLYLECITGEVFFIVFHSFGSNLVASAIRSFKPVRLSRDFDTGKLVARWSKREINNLQLMLSLNLMKGKSLHEKDPKMMLTEHANTFLRGLLSVESSYSDLMRSRLDAEKDDIAQFIQDSFSVTLPKRLTYTNFAQVIQMSQETIFHALVFDLGNMAISTSVIYGDWRSASQTIDIQSGSISGNSLGIKRPVRRHSDASVLFKTSTTPSRLLRTSSFAKKYHKARPYNSSTFIAYERNSNMLEFISDVSPLPDPIYTGVGEITCVDVDEDFIVVGGTNRNFEIYCFNCLIMTKETYKDTAVSCCVSASFKTAIVSTRDGYNIVFRLPERTIFKVIDLEGWTPLHVRVTPSWGFITTVCIKYDEGSESKAVLIHDCNGEHVFTVELDRILPVIETAEIEPGKDCIFLIREGNRLQIIEIEDKVSTREVTTFSSSVVYMKYLATYRILTVVLKTGALYLLHV